MGSSLFIECAEGNARDQELCAWTTDAALWSCARARRRDCRVRQRCPKRIVLCSEELLLLLAGVAVRENAPGLALKNSFPGLNTLAPRSEWKSQRFCS